MVSLFNILINNYRRNCKLISTASLFFCSLRVVMAKSARLQILVTQFYSFQTNNIEKGMNALIPLRYGLNNMYSPTTQQGQILRSC